MFHQQPISQSQSKLMRLIVLFPISWVFYVQLEQLSRPSSQTTWLKVKPRCNLTYWPNQPESWAVGQSPVTPFLFG
eukprot:1142464-Pelagomonas_calceolata.AAC.1